MITRPKLAVGMVFCLGMGVVLGAAFGSKISVDAVIGAGAAIMFISLILMFALELRKIEQSAPPR